MGRIQFCGPKRAKTTTTAGNKPRYTSAASRRNFGNLKELRRSASDAYNAPQIKPLDAAATDSSCAFNINCKPMKYTNVLSETLTPSILT